MNLENIAAELYQAKRNKDSIAFFRDRGVRIDVESAYRIQHQIIQLKKEEQNESVIGYKISMTSEETQKPVQTDSPAYGTFVSADLVKGEVQLDTLMAPLIEPEIVFVATEDFSIGAAKEEIVQKSKISSGIEIPESRYRNWFPPAKGATVGDYIADNACGGRIVYGEPTEIPRNIDWENINGILYHNEREIGRGISSVVLGNPLNAVYWLTQTLAKNNQFIEKGMLISSGTFTMPKLVEKGTYTVIFDGLERLSVNII